MKTVITIGISLSFLLSSCTYYMSPYTSQVQEQTNLNEEQLKKIQFYLSGDIVIYRALGNSETQITSGEIKIINGQQVQEIIIASGTPGIVIGMESDKIFKISFDKDGSYLLFGANADYAGKFTLMAKEWQGRNGIIDYAGQEYKTTPESIYAFLTVNLEEVNSRSVESKHAGGRTIE